MSAELHTLPSAKSGGESAAYREPPQNIEAEQALLGAILVSGTLLKRVWPTDLARVGAWLRGTLALDWQPLPAHAGLWTHLGLVAALLLVFPISKLVHAPGVAFAPTFHQRDRAGRGR